MRSAARVDRINGVLQDAERNKGDPSISTAMSGLLIEVIVVTELISYFSTSWQPLTTYLVAYLAAT